MTPAFANQVHRPLEEGEQHVRNLQPFPPATQAFLFPYPVFFNSSKNQRKSGTAHHDHCHHQQLEPPGLFLKCGSSDTVLLSSTINNSSENSTIIGQAISHCKYYREDVHGSGKWMSSKMQWMRKTMMSDRIVTSKPEKSKQAPQDHQEPYNNNNNSSSSPSAVIRMCSNCSTTKTPLWRSGPGGPKSLCNACGIRQRKARRAMEAATIGGGLIPAADRPCKVRKEETLDGNCTLPCKKRCKIIKAGTSLKKLPIDDGDDIMLALSQNPGFHQVPAQDEKDAAILLMALSCGLGLIHG